MTMTLQLTRTWAYLKRSGRFGSPERSFDASDEQDIRFFCHGAPYWPLMLAAIIKPDLWITLRRE
jgi:hypothetical protein